MSMINMCGHNWVVSEYSVHRLNIPKLKGPSQESVCKKTAFQEDEVG